MMMPKSSAPSAARSISTATPGVGRPASPQAPEAPSSGSPQPASRSFIRWPFRQESLEVRVIHPGGNIGTIRVSCRNLSRGGISVLHSSFVHAGSDCRVMLPHPARGVLEVPGTVVRCVHRGGVTHELGISFKSPINAREFVRTDPFSNSFSLERVNPTDLRARLLLIEPSAAERGVIRHFLRGTELQVDTANSLAEAVLAFDGVHVVVASSEMPDTDPLTIVSTIRECRFEGPIVLVVPDASPHTRSRISGLAIQSIVVQPITQDLLLRALGEVLLVEPPAAPAASSARPPSAQWVGAQLAGIGADLNRATCARNIKSIISACQRLRALAESMGWNAIVRLTNEVLAPLAKDRPLDQVRPTLDVLMTACDSGNEG